MAYFAFSLIIYYVDSWPFFLLKLNYNLLRILLPLLNPYFLPVMTLATVFSGEASRLVPFDNVVSFIRDT